MASCRCRALARWMMRFSSEAACNKKKQLQRIDDEDHTCMSSNLDTMQAAGIPKFAFGRNVSSFSYKKVLTMTDVSQSNLPR